MHVVHINRGLADTMNPNIRLQMCLQTSFLKYDWKIS